MSSESTPNPAPGDAPASAEARPSIADPSSDAMDVAPISETQAPVTQQSPTLATPAPPEQAHAESPSDAGTTSTETPAADSAGPDSAEAGPARAGAEAGEASGEAKKKKRRRKRRKGKPGTEGEAPHHSRAKPATERAPFHQGEEVFGKVTAVLEHAIMIDLSGKALGIFDRGEMEADDLVPSEADRFVATVHQDGARGGLVVLTRKPLRSEDAKPRIEAALKSGELVTGLVTGVIKGGVDVDVDGLRAFAPASGMDLHPQNANFAALLGQRLSFKVTQYEGNGRDIVVTRRPMLEAEAHERRKRALELLKEDQVLRGVVRTVVEWGVFVALPDAENLEGLVHVTEASHDPRAVLAELFRTGDTFDVKITKIDERGKIWLSRKALVEDPWAEAREKYKPGTRLTAKVSRLERFGAFIELDDGVEGLVHVSDLSIKKIDHPSEVLEIGAEIDVVVHHFDLRNHKLQLHPALTGEQADEAPQKIARNEAVKVEVVRAESAGLIVRLLGVTGRARRGFVPAGQTGTPRGTDLRKGFKPGTRLDAKIIDLDPRRGEPKLSISRFADDEERRAHRDYKKKLAAEGGFGTLGDLLSQKFGK